MIGITYGIQPYGHHNMGWTNPKVLLEIGGGILLLVVFTVIELRVSDPMFDLRLFRLRAFIAGNVASMLGSIGRGGLQFMLVIWLQGVWLPLHGYDFAQTPLYAGIAMLPMVGGFLLAGPLSGVLSDRFGTRPFAVTGPLVAAGSMAALSALPVNFSYVEFALLLLLFGIGNGMFAAPNRAAIMNSLPPWRRGVGSGMAATFQNAGQVLSVGIYFSLMIIGLSGKLPGALHSGLVANGVPAAAATHAAHLPPVSTLFAALLGRDPVTAQIGLHTLRSLTPVQQATLGGRNFFPHLITPAFSSALQTAFKFSFLAYLVAAAASWLRGGTYRWSSEQSSADDPEPVLSGQPAAVSR
jgi:MFS family permease